MKNKLRTAFVLGTGIGLFLSASLALVSVQAFETTVPIYINEMKKLSQAKPEEIVLFIAKLVAFFVIIDLIVVQTLPSTRDNADDWGQRLTNWWRKKYHHEEYFLTKAEELYEQANKYKESAERTIAAIRKEFESNKKDFLINVSLKVKYEERPSEEIKKIGLLQENLFRWQFQLHTAEHETNYYSAKEKLIVARNNFAELQELLDMHHAHPAKHREKHSKIRKAVGKKENDITLLENLLEKLEKKILRFYILTKALLNGSDKNKTLSFYGKNEEKFICLQELLERSISLEKSQHEKERYDYHFHKKEDSVLPNLIEDPANSCHRKVRKRNRDQTGPCCIFYTGYESRTQPSSFQSNNPAGETTPLLQPAQIGASSAKVILDSVSVP